MGHVNVWFLLAVHFPTLQRWNGCRVMWLTKIPLRFLSEINHLSRSYQRVSTGLRRHVVQWDTISLFVYYNDSIPTVQCYLRGRSLRYKLSGHDLHYHRSDGGCVPVNSLTTHSDTRDNMRCSVQGRLWYAPHGYPSSYLWTPKYISRGEYADIRNCSNIVISARHVVRLCVNCWLLLAQPYIELVTAMHRRTLGSRQQQQQTGFKW